MDSQFAWWSVAACLPVAMACGSEAGATALGEPRDLIARVRLVASATATDSLFVREAEESIATVRDDFPDTGWKTPVGAESVVQIDLQAWLARPVPLYRLSAVITGKAPAKCSMRTPINRSMEPMMAAWIITICSCSPFSFTQKRSNRSGIFMSNWMVAIWCSRPSASFAMKSSFGP